VPLQDLNKDSVIIIKIWNLLEPNKKFFENLFLLEFQKGFFCDAKLSHERFKNIKLNFF
jgi:hypothetical protein